MPTYAEQLKVWRQAFKENGIETAALDARLLLQHVSGFDAAQLITKDQLEMPENQLDTLRAFCERRLSGEPIARIIGHKEFFGRIFSLNKDTLVPRPETELLVEAAIEGLPKGGTFLDLGTGTGAIAISILAERSDARGVATDLSEAALDCAVKNARSIDVADRLSFTQSDWFSNIEAREFDLVVSNPPYIADSERSEMNDEALRYDPRLALFANNEGLAAYQTIAAEASAFLKADGWLMVEIGFRQGEAVSALFVDNGFKKVSIVQDLSGLDRVVLGQR